MTEEEYERFSDWCMRMTMLSSITKSAYNNRRDGRVRKYGYLGEEKPASAATEDGGVENIPTQE